MISGHSLLEFVFPKTFPGFNMNVVLSSRVRVNVRLPVGHVHYHVVGIAAACAGHTIASIHSVGKSADGSRLGRRAGQGHQVAAAAVIWREADALLSGSRRQRLLVVLLEERRHVGHARLLGIVDASVVVVVLRYYLRPVREKKLAKFDVPSSRTVVQRRATKSCLRYIWTRSVLEKYLFKRWE